MSDKMMIEFAVLYEAEEHHIRCYSNEYRNLMALLRDKLFPDDFGECGGMGRCGTCLVRVEGASSQLYDSYKNEATTLSKMGVTEAGVRLSCQIQIDDDLKNTIIRILDPV
jgi:2Fe-2S ferredoxin